MNIDWSDLKYTGTQQTHCMVLAKILLALYKSDESIIGIEIGVQNGSTSFYLLDNIPNLTLYGIDNAPCLDHIKEHGGYEKAVKDKRFRLITDISDKAVKQFKPQSMNFVWVDGDHSYEQCKKDIENYLPITKKFIGGHDYGVDAWPGVTQAVDEAFGDRVNVMSDLTWMVEL